VKFWDTSALIPLVLREASSAAIRSLYEGDSEAVVWWGTRVECTSAIVRRAREGQLDEGSETHARERLRQLLDVAQEVGPTEDVRNRAERALAVHPLRAADALQLAAALIWARERPAGRELVSLDARLREAARREGFTLLPA